MTQIFPLDPRRPIAEIQVSWGDRGRGRARGRVYLEDSGTESLTLRRVQGEGEVVAWGVEDFASGLRLRAYNETLFIFWVRVYYAETGTALASGPVCIYGPTNGQPIYVRQDTLSQSFLTPDPRSPVRAIRLLWEDRGGDASGILLLNGDSRSPYPPEAVSSPGEVRWIVNEPIESFVIYAMDDSLFLSEVWVEY
jgi:hypothetical protein